MTIWYVDVMWGVALFAVAFFTAGCVVFNPALRSVRTMGIVAAYGLGVWMVVDLPLVVALATWWYGDDIRWDPRPECEKGHAEAPFAAMPKGGWPGDHPLFPLRWRAANLEEE